MNRVTEMRQLGLSYAQNIKGADAAYLRDLHDFEEIIGYKFKDINLLVRALTHSSFANEEKTKGGTVHCNERMEFLGDSVLSLVVSTYLFENFPRLNEGEMSKLRAYAVCERALAEYAAKIKLGSYLRLGRGEDNASGRSRPSITSDAFEAVIAAIYLDSRSIESAEKFVLPYATEKIAEYDSEHMGTDYKTLLQQIVQQEKGEVLEYVLVSESGPSHNKSFEIEARLNSNVIGKGAGKSKRIAEQLAAKQALTLFGDK